jgi:S-adenosylmethionine:tRNA ribosyltransferase-isomerase
MRVADFDFDLPEERIALRPAKPRDAAKLLVVEPGRFLDRGMRDLPSLLNAGDVLVFNKTKVIPAALSGKRIGRGDAEPHIEALLHQRLDGSRWKAFARPGKRLAVGDRVRFGAEGRVCLLGTLEARVEEKDEGGEITLAFDFHGPILDEAVATLGDMPLPPYIAGKREADDQDRQDYQTIFAEDEGAIAAPTAGLHFTSDLIKSLQSHGIKTEFVTLHVGAGTFMPVKAEDTEEHKMHAEWGEVPGTWR